jgi:hypothetical protein
MSENKPNEILVNLLKKAVGLPTQKSSCCGAPVLLSIQDTQLPVEGQDEKINAGGEQLSSCCDVASPEPAEACCGANTESSTSSGSGGSCCGS